MARHLSWTRLLDHAAGRPPGRGVEKHLAACRACAGRAEEARRLVSAGRAAAAFPRTSRRALRRARKAFLERPRPRGSVLRLVLDSLLRPAPALRAAAGGATRFLRFEGDDTTVELQLTKAARGFELRGQVTPVDHAAEVVADLGASVRRARVRADGTFVFRTLPARRFSLRVGGSHVRDLLP